MKTKSKKPIKTPKRNKSKKNNLGKESHTSTDKKHLEKLFDEMKNNIIKEISKVAETKINENRDIIINNILEKEHNNEDADANISKYQIVKKERKAKKSKNSNKNGKANSPPEENTPLMKEEKKSPIPSDSNKINTKSKNKKALPKKNKAKKKTNKNRKDAIVNSSGEKTDSSSLIEISKITTTIPKLSKIIVKEKEKEIKDNLNKNNLDNSCILIGKKRNRKKDDFVMLINSEPNFEINAEKKSKKKCDNKMSKSIKKVRKTK